MAASRLAPLLAAFLLALAVLPARTASAAVPPLLNYQGYLTDGAAQPRTGTFPMTFHLFADSIGGSALWTEAYAAVAVQGGVFTVLLGSVSPVPLGSLLTGGVLWLQTTVDGNVLAPRRPIVSVAYAMRSAVADSAAVAGGGIRTIARAALYSNDNTDNGVLGGRSVNLTKQSSSTGVRVSWNDNFRVSGAGRACRWEVLFNGAPCASPGPLMFDKFEQDAANNSHDPGSFFGTCFGLPAGLVIVTTRVGPSPGFPLTDCYTGWNSALATIEAEEVR